MILLDGKQLGKQIKLDLKEKVKQLKEKYHITPCMAIVLLGHDPASLIYVRNKVKAAEFIGIDSKTINLSEDTTEEDLLTLIDELNQDPTIHGIIVQLPLPRQINERHIIDSVSDEKDIDAFKLINKGKLFSGLEAMYPATPSGIIKLLKNYHVEMCGKHAVVVGRSNIVGKPVAMMLLSENATVTIAHSKTVNLKQITSQADILVVAIGKARFITADMVKDQAVVIDVGVNREDGKIYGDVDFENVKDKCSYITPVPGGVGPLTIATLLENTLTSFEKIMEKKKVLK